MQSIRKLIQNRKDEERKHKETLVLVDRPDCRPQLTISIDDVLKFSSDHWLCVDSLYKENEEKPSRFFEAMRLFKSFSHVSRIKNSYIFHLKNNLPGSQPRSLQFFLEKLKERPELQQTIELIQKLQRLQQILRETYSSMKRNVGSHSQLGKTLIHNIFVKGVESFGSASALVMCYNIDFNTMRPFLESIAITDAFLELLQWKPQDFMLEVLKSGVFPEMFSNYGFVQWNNRHLCLIHKVQENILKQETGQQTNPTTQGVRQIIDKNHNRMVVQIQAGFNVPIYSYFKIKKVVKSQECKVKDILDGPPKLVNEIVKKVMYPYAKYGEYLEEHTASYREVDKEQSD